MASTSAPYERSKISWESSEAESSHPTLLSILNVRESTADTACTQFSLATTNFPNTTPSPRTPIVTFVERPQPPQERKRRGSLVSPWSLLRSKSARDSASTRRQTVPPTALGEQMKATRISRWWSTNRPVSKDDKTEKRTAPPVPPRPEPLFLVKPLESNPFEQSVSSHGNLRHLSASSHQPLQTIQELLRAPQKGQLAGPDPDEEDSEFTRIHAEGWNKIIPKQWMEDQFSQGPSETDEERSFYSQDNGEDESKQKLASQHASPVHIQGFPAGEARPFDPLSNVQVETPSRHPEWHVRTPQGQQPEETIRWPFEGSISSSTLSSPVHHWLTSVPPPSSMKLCSPTPKAKTEARESTWLPRRVASHDEISQPSGENNSTLYTPGKHVSSLKNHKNVRLTHMRDHHLIPLPLSVQPRAPGSVTTIQTQEERTIPADEVSIHSAPPSLQPTSSWSTILCPQSDSISVLHQSTQHGPSVLPTRRQSDRNKPLPLPPDESSVETKTQNPPRRDSLTDNVDEILNLYNHSDGGGDGDKRDYDEVSTLRTSSSPSSSTNATASTIRNSSTPPKRPPRTPDTELSLVSPLAPFSAANVLRKGASRFVARYPIFYDAGSYPELGQGRPHEDGNRSRRRSGRAVTTFVDEMGETWI